MSGFEIAGLVLGALPLVCEAAKQMELVFQNTKSWWMFERSFEEFTAAVIDQEIAYRQVLKRLVGPLDIPFKEYQQLISNPNSNLWYQSHIISRLKLQLQEEEYDWFMDNLKNLNTSVAELYKLMPVDKVHHLDSKLLESELFRLQTSFSNEKNRLLAKITKINNDLHQFLHRATEVSKEPIRGSKESGISFKELQNQANEIYECLASSWSCCCPTEHVVGITAHILPSSPRKNNGAVHLNLLFEHQVHRKQMKIQIEGAACAKGVKFGAEEASNHFTAAAASSLKRDIALRKHQRSVSTAASESTVSALAISSLSITGSQASEPVPRKSILKRAAQKLKLVSPLRTLPQSTSHTQTNSPMNCSPVLKLNSTTSTLVTQVSAASVETPSSVSIITASTENISEVRFAGENSLTAPEPHESAQSMFNICQLATDPISDENKIITFPSAKQNRVALEHDLPNQGAIEAAEMHKIDSVFSHIPRRLDRLYIGMQLALTLLSLANSAWIPRNLAKKDIFLVCSKKGNQKGTLGRPLGPYFSGTSHTIKGQLSGVWYAQSSLLLLGVLLLELYHGKRLEQQKCWEENLVDGEPNEITTYCSAFQWAQQTKESIEKDWGKDLGGELSDAIIKCLRFDFEQEDEYGDANLVNLVYKEVILPLEKCFPKHFN